MTINPAKLCNLDSQGLGMLKVSGPADITLIDPAHSWVLGLDDLAGKSVNTPFLGWEMAIRPMMTIVKGNIRFDRMGD